MWSRVSLAWSRFMLWWSRRSLPRARRPARGWLTRPWPSKPLWSRRTALNVTGSVVSVAVAVAAVVVALLADKGHHSSAASRTPPPSGSSSASALYIPPVSGPTLTDTGLVAVSLTSSGTGSATATDTVTPSGAGSSSDATGTTEVVARQAVVAYLNAVNARNRVQAGSLICQSLQPTWLQNVDTANSDFNFTVTSARFTGSSPLGGGSLVLHYTLEFNDNTTNSVDFTVIDENGPKICGERRA